MWALPRNEQVPGETFTEGQTVLGDVAADQDVVGALGARVMAKAILRAVQAAETAYGFPAVSSL